MSHKLDKTNLKPGDRVGILMPTRIGYSYFRYPTLWPMTIKRITPARTKFVMEDGHEFGNGEPFYQIDEKMAKESWVAKCAVNLFNCLNELETLNRSSRKIFNMDDDCIIKFSAMLDEVVKEIKKGKKE